MEPDIFFFMAVVAVDPELLLPNMLFRKFFSLEFRNRLSAEVEAQRDERGRKMTTAVMTSDDMAGLSTKYCSIENTAAMKCQWITEGCLINTMYLV